MHSRTHCHCELSDACFLMRWAIGIGLCTLLCLGGGCVYKRVVKDGWAQLRALSDSPSPSRARKKELASTTPENDKWSILIEQYEGQTGKRQATRLINQLHNQTRLPDLWVHEAPSHTLVYRGLYDRPTDTRAISDLRQTRLVRLKNGQSFTSAKLIALGSASETSALDLRQHSGMYSLQIAYYDDAFGSKFRQAAEQAAQTLHADGNESFYYHGPHRSMITLGLFTNDDFVQKGVHQVYGPRIKALQEKFPYNLGNGRTIVEKVNNQSLGAQPSFLVRVN